MKSSPKSGTAGLKGKVHIKVWNNNTGEVEHEFTRDNLVVTAGANLMAQILVASGSPTLPTHIAVGTSNTAVAAGQTALQGTELARVAFTTGTHPSRTDNAIEYSSTFLSGVGTGTIEEAAILNATAAGTMLARVLTGTFTKGASSQMTVTWTITLSPV